MKRIITLILPLCLFTAFANGQKVSKEMTERRVTFDTYFKADFYINRLFPAQYRYGSHFENDATGTGLRLNYRFSDHYGIFSDLSFTSGLSDENLSPEVFNLFSDYIDLDNGYTSRDDDDNNWWGSGTFSVGFFRRDWFGRFALTTYLNWELYYFRKGKMNYTYKEHDSNNQYIAEYSWVSKKHFHGIHIGAEIKWKAWERLGLFAGVGYSIFFDKTRFESVLRDWYDGSELKRISASGRNPGYFSLSLGVSFMGSTTRKKKDRAKTFPSFI